MDFEDPKQAICCCCSVTTVVLLGLMIFFSYSSLESTEYGLDYSRITKSLDSSVYSSGYHYLGFMHKFIKYPSTVQSMEFNSDSTSSSA
jgi:hypothetical protein